MLIDVLRFNLLIWWINKIEAAVQIGVLKIQIMVIINHHANVKCIQ